MGLQIPRPSRVRRGQHTVALSTRMSAKAALYTSMHVLKMSKAELAIHLNCDEKEVGRLLNPRHQSQLHKIESALSILGKKLVVGYITNPQKPIHQSVPHVKRWKAGVKLWMNWQENLSGSSHSLYELNHAIQSFDQTNRGLVDRLVVESLQIGAKEMLETEITFESDTIMTTVEIPMPHWAEKAGARSWNISMNCTGSASFRRMNWSEKIGQWHKWVSCSKVRQEEGASEKLKTTTLVRYLQLLLPMTTGVHANGDSRFVTHQRRRPWNISFLVSWTCNSLIVFLWNRSPDRVILPGLCFSDETRSDKERNSMIGSLSLFACLIEYCAIHHGLCSGPSKTKSWRSSSMAGTQSHQRSSTNEQDISCMLWMLPWSLKTWPLSQEVTSNNS